MRFFLVLLLIANPVFAQIETSEQNFLESKAILKEIQQENRLQKGNVDIRTGLFQVSANKPADPSLNFLTIIGFTIAGGSLLVSFMHRML
jgi:hypothetical protein